MTPEQKLHLIAAELFHARQQGLSLDMRSMPYPPPEAYHGLSIPVVRSHVIQEILNRETTQERTPLLIEDAVATLHEAQIHESNCHLMSKSFTKATAHCNCWLSHDPKEKND